MDEMELRDRWQYYISSWTRTEPTEGVPRSHMQKAVLTRNLAWAEADSENQPKAVSYHEGLVLKICLNTSKIIYDNFTSNYFVYNVGGGSEEAVKRQLKRRVIRESKNQRFLERMSMNSPWMKNLSQEEVQQAKEDYRKWKDEGIPPQSADDEQMEASAGSA